jgi:anti-anti-sigma factor
MASSASGSFQVSAAHITEALVITVSGELDAETVTEFAGHLDQVAAESGPLVVDMTQVTFCDSSGLNALVNAVARGVDLRVVGSRQVFKVLNLAGVAQSLKLEASVAEAIKAVDRLD